MVTLILLSWAIYATYKWRFYKRKLKREEESCDRLMYYLLDQGCDDEEKKVTGSSVVPFKMRG